MLCTPPSPLRSAAFSCQIQPSLFTAASHTSAATSLHRNGRAKASALRSLNHRISPTIPPSHIILRPSSTIAFVRPLTTATSTPTDSVSSTASPNLTWNDFLRLRKVRRRYNLAASISCSIATTAIGIPILSQQDIDALGGQVFGLDPLVVLGLATASFGAVGWFAGPLIGGTAFNMVNGRWKGQIAAKEKEFYQRINRYRVDPSSHSFSNPVPDYYGEKIGSVQGYRQWLKDQRAYNKKRQSFL